MSAHPATPLSDAELAAHLAEVAGRLLLEVRAAGVFSAKALGKTGDQTANQFLIHAIRAQRPDDGLLSEEEQDNFERLAHSRVWIIDPVDGTREYGEERSDWAVHIGLAIDGVPAVGAVALPGLGVTLRTDQPPVLPPAAAAPRMVISRTRPAKEALAVAEAIDAQLVPMAAPGPKRWQSCEARRRSISTPAVSTNGIAARRPPWRWLAGCMSAALTERLWFITSATFTCQTC